MTTREFYAHEPAESVWEVPASGSARFSWDYQDGRERLLSLYQKGKDKQWDATTRIDWDLPVDPYDPLGIPDENLPVHDTPYWDRMTDRNKDELRRLFASWQFSQFLHGEQGAMVCAARIVESVPDLDAKFYSATQTMDEARHAEIFGRFLHEKVGLVYPVDDNLQALLGDTLRDSRWDMPYLGMQVLIEGLALAAFGMLRDTTDKPLPRQILAYVMQDEARHVAFGRMALRDHYAQLTEKELREREEFVIEGCYLMRDRLRGEVVLTDFGLPAADAAELSERSSYLRLFRKLLFSRIVPCVKDIGLWGERLQRAYVDMGVLEMGDSSLDLLMAQDEELAERFDAERFAAEEEARREEVAAVIAAGAGASEPEVKEGPKGRG
ncbi:ferritin-like domain-containing protein [Streptomyces albireticuli]|uniref:Aminobenzoate oxygenase n=1 Tax=Streptomyces albireticuli TaxID=1940 RepID=A0A2A2D3L9_9ACTN|nr:ferritin-like domain-containing protein [Streptomyces albireticuli]MCD9142397.1 ferritin-like domain-containing protein [Streptomyces albireticuli]MCD9166042.1 ferritin-like domain-containing protein [Streptomyces albireticuli]MCD9192525.1 ferritin-like domain-containing protein [Streptomyces albireticuli]PAU45999.1 aminobenzoate oxygenase [Streptomyces albireticuli]